MVRERLILGAGLLILASCSAHSWITNHSPVSRLNVNIDESAEGTEIDIQRGQSFSLTLKENPSTGYVWKFIGPLPDSVTLLGESTDRSSEEPGAPVVHRWRLRAGQQGGRVPIELQSMRTWSPSPNDHKFGFTLKISNEQSQ